MKHLTQRFCNHTFKEVPQNNTREVLQPLYSTVDKMVMHKVNKPLEILYCIYCDAKIKRNKYEN